LTVRRELVPAVCVLGARVLPREVPGAAVSPGARICNFENAPPLTVTLGLVLAVNAPAASVAVIVRVPAVLNVKLESDAVPAASVILPEVAPLSSAMAALLSEVVMATLGVALLTTFQLASTALTSTPLVRP